MDKSNISHEGTEQRNGCIRGFGMVDGQRSKALYRAIRDRWKNMQNGLEWTLEKDVVLTASDGSVWV